MRRRIVLIISGAALLALLFSCGQKEEQAQMEKAVEQTAEEVQTASAKVIDPVCGMSIDVEAAVMAEHERETYYFCSPQHKEQFLQDPAKYMTEKEIVDPVCGMKVDPETAIKGEYEGKMYQFCSAECHDTFMKDPGKHMSPEGHHMEGESHEVHGH